MSNLCASGARDDQLINPQLTSAAICCTFGSGRVRPVHTRVEDLSFFLVRRLPLLRFILQMH